MEVQIAALCDSAADYNGKLCIMGTFDTIASQMFPIVQPQCSIALRILFRDDDEGVHSLKIGIVDEDGVPLVNAMDLNPPIDVRLPEGAEFFTRNIVCNLQHLKFEKPGSYSVDITADGRPLAAIPFRIVRFQPPVNP